MARLFDEKDVRIVAQAIESVGPDSVAQRTWLILEAARMAMVFPSDIEQAIKEMKERNR